MTSATVAAVRDVSVDSTIARAHQHAAGARTRPERQREPPGEVEDEPADHAVGRSRGGWTAKVHLACEQGRKPLAMLVTGGQRGDSPQFTRVLARLRVPRPDGGRPRTRPDRVLADKAYTSRGNRAELRPRGIPAAIPIKIDQVASRRKKGPRVAGHRPSTPSSTGSVTPSGAASRLKLHRAVVTRFDKLAVRYQATLHVAAINKWL